MSNKCNIPALPVVVLMKKFQNSFKHFFRKELKQFVREEGGYLIGKFLGETVEIHYFYHDIYADRTLGEIKLSTEAFDQAETIARDQDDNALTVIGTWHTHPPGFGVRYSSTDVETLFIDRMILNSSDPSNYHVPWVHIIVSGKNFSDMAVYTLCIDSGLEIEKVSEVIIPLNKLKLPKDHSLGFLIEPMKMNRKYFSLSKHVLSYALKKQRLQGFWRWCRPEVSNLRWELLFIENFLRNIRNIKEQGSSQAKVILADSFLYTRLIPQGDGKMVLCEHYQFKTPKSQGHIRFESLQFVTEDIPLSLTLESSHPEGQTVTCDVIPHTTIVNLMTQVQQKLSLKTAPILWTLLKPEGIRRFQKRAKVDQFGKIYLPEDALVSEILEQVATQETPIYWESTELNPGLVRQLRTYRFEQMGYNLEALRKRHVLIAGIGLLGCEIANHLGVLGVGTLTLLDNGRVDWVDIYRQSLYRQHDVGSPKVLAAAKILEEMGCHVQPLDWSIPSVLISDVQQATEMLEDLYELTKKVDAVVGSLDSFSTRAVLQILCRVNNIPFLSASLDYLPEFAFTQGSVSFYHRKFGQCYGCGCDIKTQIDRGACTNTPIEFPKIVGSLAAKVLVDFLGSRDSMRPVQYRIYHDYRIEKNELSCGAYNCTLCNISTHINEKHDVSQIIAWLIS